MKKHLCVQIGRILHTWHSQWNRFFCRRIIDMGNDKSGLFIESFVFTHPFLIVFQLKRKKKRWWEGKNVHSSEHTRTQIQNRLHEEAEEQKLRVLTMTDYCSVYGFSFGFIYPHDTPLILIRPSQPSDFFNSTCVSVLEKSAAKSELPMALRIGNTTAFFMFKMKFLFHLTFHLLT